LSSTNHQLTAIAAAAITPTRISSIRTARFSIEVPSSLVILSGGAENPTLPAARRSDAVSQA
jgi:hypothetical protein